MVMKQEFKIATESKNSAAKKQNKEDAKKTEREAKESGQHWGRRRNLASQGVKKECEIHVILKNALRQS